MNIIGIRKSLIRLKCLIAILANLPYIEWLKLNNKKHIAFVGKNTHPFETLKQMSPLDSVGISTLDSKGTNAIKVKTVIVTDNVLDTISTPVSYTHLDGMMKMQIVKIRFGGKQ